MDGEEDAASTVALKMRKGGMIAGSSTRCLTKDSNCSTSVCGITLKAGCCEPCEVLAYLMQLYDLPTVNSMSTVGECFFCKNELAPS